MLVHSHTQADAAKPHLGGLESGAAVSFSISFYRTRAYLDVGYYVQHYFVLHCHHPQKGRSPAQVFVMPWMD